MARIIQDDQGGSNAADSQLTVIQIDGEKTLALPEGDFMSKGEILRDGQDLVLQSSDGHQVIVENYFSALPAPTLTTPGGSMLTPELVQSFARPESLQYAANESGNDASAIGIIKELSGDATITRANGTPEKAVLGMEVHQGDIVETGAQGGVNIVFLDESSFAISSNARMAIDEYVYDPATQGGETNISILRGMFVFTSGLIGRDDPDDVHIETPVGSIGIRGTTIAGNIQPDGQSQITVVEGAIVIKNGSGEVTLAEQYQTVTIVGFETPIQMTGTLEASQMKSAYGVIGTVAPAFMNTLNIMPETEKSEQPAEAAPDKPADAPADSPSQSPADAAELGAEQGQAEAAQPVVASYDIFNDPLNSGFDESVSAETHTPFNTTTVTSASLLGASGLSFMTAAPISLSGTKTAIASVVDPVAAAPALPLEVIVKIYVDDNAMAGDVVGKVFTTIAHPNVTIKFTNVPTDNGSPVFELVHVGAGVYNVVLTAAGDHALSLISGTTVTSLGSVEVLATLPDGRSASSSATSHYGDFDNSNPPTVTPGVIVDLNLNGLTSTDGQSMHAPAGSGLGYHAAYLGDYNRDGTPDFVYTYGGNSKLSIGGNDLTMNTNQIIVAGNGDMNGDGRLDFVTGSAFYNTNQGHVRVYSGNYLYTSANINGAPGDLLGSSVAMVDFNGDGYADIFTGAMGAGSNEGQVSYYLGKYAMSFTGGLSYTVLIEGTSGGHSDMLGNAMSSIKDYDNDGFGDLAIGRMTSATTGEVIILKGNSTASISEAARITVSAVDEFHIPIVDLGDINGDGKSDILIGETGYNANSDALMEGRILISLGGSGGVSTTINAADGSSIVGVGSVGDFNGDGYNDIFVATRTGNTLDAYVIYGSTGLPSSLTLDATWLANNPSAHFHMTLDLTAYGSPTEFGMSSIGVGDQNGDGYEDFLMTMPDLNNGDGGYYLIYGRADAQPLGGAIQGAVGSTGNDTLTNFGNSLQSFRAGSGDDTIRLHGTGNAIARVIDGGSGIDTLSFASDGNIDLSNISQLNSIEKIVLEGTGTQSLTIGLNDIFTLLQTSNHQTDAGKGNLFTVIFGNDNGSTGKQLLIDAANPSLTSMSAAGFTAQGSYTEGGNTYDIYTFGSGYQLLIDSDIAVTVQ